MDVQSVESAISISPYSEYSCAWSDDNKTLTITYDDPMEYETLYQISISTTAKDLANRGLEDKFEAEFTTEVKPIEKNGEDFPFLYLVLALLVVVIIIVLMLVLVISKKKKAPTSGVDSELFGGVAQAPQTIQSQYPIQPQVHPQSQVQQSTLSISCPKCYYNFSVVKSQGPIQIQCPNCGTQGTLR